MAIHSFSRRRGTALAPVLAGALLCASMLAGVVAAAVQAGPAGASPPTYARPQMHHDSMLTGTSLDPALSVSNGGSLGVHWMVNTGAMSLSSPVAAYNATVGKTLIFAGNEAGDFAAYDATSGLPVWSENLGGPIRSTPLTEGSYVWVVPATAGRIYKLTAATGAVVCSAPLSLPADSSPTIATPPGGSPTVYLGLTTRARTTVR